MPDPLASSAHPRARAESVASRPRHGGLNTGGGPFANEFDGELLQMGAGRLHAAAAASLS